MTTKTKRILCAVGCVLIFFTLLLGSLALLTFAGWLFSLIGLSYLTELNLINYFLLGSLAFFVAILILASLFISIELAREWYKRRLTPEEKQGLYGRRMAR